MSVVQSTLKDRVDPAVDPDLRLCGGAAPDETGEDQDDELFEIAPRAPERQRDSGITSCAGKAPQSRSPAPSREIREERVPRS